MTSQIQADTPPPPPTDAENHLTELLVQTGRGNTQAFARLYDLTASRVIRIALRHAADEGTAEAALERTYLSIWTHAPRFTPGQPATAWILHHLEYAIALDVLPGDPRRARRMRGQPCSRVHRR